MILLILLFYWYEFYLIYIYLLIIKISLLLHILRLWGLLKHRLVFKMVFLKRVLSIIKPSNEYKKKRVYIVHIITNNMVPIFYSFILFYSEIYFFLDYVLFKEFICFRKWSTTKETIIT